MAIDISSLSSLYSLLNGTTNTNNSTSGNSTANFQNYLLSALGTNSISGTNNADISSLLMGNSSNGNLSSLTASDTASQLLASLQNYGASTSNLEALYGLTNERDSSPSLTNSFTSVLDAKILNSMNAAKAKLSANYADYVNRMGENPTNAVQLRINEMQRNIQVIDQYVSSKSTSVSNNLLNSSNGSSTNTQALLEKLQANGDLTKSILNM